MDAPYTLDSSIELFFLEANNSATREECDGFALTLVHEVSTVTPVAIQGAFSYTVLASEDKIFQFRFPSSSINIELVNLAATIHGNVIARCKYHGTIGEPNGLQIYEMGKLPGVPYIIGLNRTIPQPPTAVESQQRTVQDFAKYHPTTPYVLKNPANRREDSSHKPGTTPKAETKPPSLCSPPNSRANLVSSRNLSRHASPQSSTKSDAIFLLCLRATARFRWS